jgi:iron complex outermembrane recepter protein
MKKVLLFALPFLSLTFGLQAQAILTGIVSDGNTNEPLIGATVVYDIGKGTATDLEGSYSLSIPPGTYTVTVSFVGFEKENRQITLKAGRNYANFSLYSITLTEVMVVADMATTRETPVAFATILPAKLNEELGVRDIPMVLNSTPGVYATPQGGGDGDAEVTIRGFDSRNVGVLLDGIPVNDMENGQVYWSNWFGLDLVTRSIQVQRGLGASKLALPSVGGTINIVTKGIENKREVSIKQELTSEGRYRSSIGYNSGRLPKGWGVTLAGSYKWGEGWVDQTWSEAWFYYAKIDKQLGKHMISFSAMGAPQSHGQRRYSKPIATYDTTYARELGIEKFPAKAWLRNQGYQYNPYWGYIDRDPADSTNAPEVLNERVNMYYKPMYSIRHFWNAGEKLYISNVAYLSIGTGGGTRLRPSSISDNSLDTSGQINWQKIYDANRGPFSVVPYYHPTDHLASNYLSRQTNNHTWYGWLTTFNYKINQAFSLSGGVDLRSYLGEHYEQIWDLLGADYAIELSDVNHHPDSLLYEGDKVFYHNDGLVRWGGIFTQAEYKRNKLTAFINLTAAQSWYKRIDYFLYTPENQESEWVPVPGFTAKTGLNYNFTRRSNAFINLGYLSKARGFNYTFVGFSNIVQETIENELVKAIEGGYSYSSPRFSVNTNAYYTRWDNRPSPTFRSIYEGENIEGLIEGLDALHKGFELDLIWKPLPKMEVEGLLSLGDWKYNVADSIDYYYVDDNLFAKTEFFDARGVHVSGSAQTQFGGSIRYEPFKGFYIKAQLIRFSRYFSEFDPESLGNAALRDENGMPRDSWQTPSYSIFDIFAGYRFTFNGLQFDLRASVLNASDVMYITNAQNNDPNISPSFQNFDAQSASVFFGLGRRFNTSLSIKFN